MIYDSLILRIQNVLSPDLLSSKYRKLNHSNRLRGHCYAASEALYHMLGAKQSGFVPQVLHVGTDTHWYLKNSSGFILDPTKDQFPFVPKYELGRGTGYLTRGPSKRAKEIIRRVSRL